MDADYKHKDNYGIEVINSTKPVDKEQNSCVKSAQDETSLRIDRVTFEGLNDIDSICSSNTIYGKLPAVPDGGWGWMVVASAFMVSACADGLAFSFGLLHEEFTKYFETTQYKTSLIGSFFIAAPLLAGPVMSALVDRYGCRIMTMCAGILSTIAFLLASISNSIEMLCLTFGLLSGLAMGILYVTAVVSVAFWFDKKRNLAVSLASCGIGFGTLIYSPLTHYLLQVYDWRNCIIILAGTLLNMCVCGALMRDPEWLHIKQKQQSKHSKARSRKTSSTSSICSKSIAGDESMFLKADELKSILKSGQSPEYIFESLLTSISVAKQLETTTEMNAKRTLKRTQSVIIIPTFVQHQEKERRTDKKLNNVANSSKLIDPTSTLAMRRSKTIIELQVLANEDDQNKVGTHNEDRMNKVIITDGKVKYSQQQRHKNPNPEQTHYRQKLSADHPYTFRSTSLYRNSVMNRGAMINIPRHKERASSLPNISKNSSWSIETPSEDMRWYDWLLDTCKTTFDIQMFTEFHFLMFSLSSLILSVWFIVPYFFLKSYMTSRHMEGGEMMISIIGVSSSIGIVVLGWAGDQPWANVTKTYSVCLMMCGAAVAVYPLFITNYWILAVISAVFGLSFASSYSYTPAMLMELMPIDNFTIAYGLVLLSQGIGHLIGPPLAGLLYDVTGTWDLTFYTAGVWLVISGLCLGVIAFTKDRRICGKAPLRKLDDVKTSINV